RYIQNKLLAITGTNGKTTTTFLTAHVLNASGKPARALGNSGIPLTSELVDNSIESNVIIVAELSSFQLDTLQAKVIDVGVILNITPDHLDRYPDMRSYALSKYHLKDCLKPHGKLFIEEQCYRAWNHLLNIHGDLVYGYKPSSFLYTDRYHLYVNGKKEYL